jgi:hypothetical protein
VLAWLILYREELLFFCSAGSAISRSEIPPHIHAEDGINLQPTMGQGNRLRTLFPPLAPVRSLSLLQLAEVLRSFELARTQN